MATDSTDQRPEPAPDQGAGSHVLPQWESDLHAIRLAVDKLDAAITKYAPVVIAFAGRAMMNKRVAKMMKGDE